MAFHRAMLANATIENKDYRSTEINEVIYNLALFTGDSEGIKKGIIDNFYPQFFAGK